MKKLLVISVAIAAASLAHAESKVELFGFLDQGVTVLHENANLGMAGPVGQRAPNILNSALQRDTWKAQAMCQHGASRSAKI